MLPTSIDAQALTQHPAIQRFKNPTSLDTTLSTLSNASTFFTITVLQVRPPMPLPTHVVIDRRDPARRSSTL